MRIGGLGVVVLVAVVLEIVPGQNGGGGGGIRVAASVCGNVSAWQSYLS